MLALSVLAALAVFVAVFRIATSPQLVLLYGGLDAAAAGEVALALEQRGIAHQVRGDSIFVPLAERDAVRVSLAADGLPANGPAGYELLDAITGFGTTSQMFDATYWRAKEGELARTIMSSAAIRSARVHLTGAEARPFAPRSAPSASVTVSPAGPGLSASHARALRYLVASAVAGLDPANVSVIDGRNGRVLSDEDAEAAGAPDDRAAELRRRAERILEARLGPGNAVVEVSVETVRQSEQVRERIVDPDSRVLISSENEERSTAATDTRPGAVTVASNLPDGDADSGGAQSSSDDTELRERSNYDVSETTREVVRGPGGIERMTVAVLVNSNRQVGPDTEASPEELSDLADLVASAVGIDEARGDVVTIRSLPFTERPSLDLPESNVMGRLAQSIDVMQLAQLLTLLVVTLVLALFVIRPLLLAKPQPVGTDNAKGPRALPSPGGPALGETPVAIPKTDAGIPRTDTSQALVQRVGENRANAAEVLRSWMAQDSVKG